MSNHEDWLDDYVIMEMMEEDEDNESSDCGSTSPSSAGCLPRLLLFFLVLVSIIKIFGS